MKKFLLIIISIAVLLVAFIAWVAWGNTALQLNSYSIEAHNLPKSFDGFRIAQISDFHNCEIGKNNERLISILDKADPDIIVITGDMIDSRSTDVDIALAFAKSAVEIAPCYYVTGNHEKRVEEYAILREGLTSLGVVVLNDDKTNITLSGESITLIGVDDPSFQADLMLDDADLMKEKLNKLTSYDDGYSILLSHRPELFDTYVESNVDLVFSGHAHGGQFRIPLVGGVIAPNQGVFPQYDSGIYDSNGTYMVVSRGVGNSIIPFRVNNRPEVILVTLNA